MKLWTKIALSVAAVTAALGMIGVGAGLAMGAKFDDLNEMGIYLTPYHQFRKTVVKELREERIEESIEDSIETGSSHHGMEGSTVAGSSHHGMEGNIVTGNSHHSREHLYDDNLYSHSCSLQDIDRLKIDVQNAEIKIFAVEEAVGIDYFSNIRNDISRKDGSTLKIADHSALDSKIELEIFIPIGVLKEIEIDAAAGAIVVDRIVADVVSLEVDAASVRIDELVVEKEAELQINAGEMIIGYYDGPRLDVECDMGSIMVVCEGNQHDYNYEMECGMGEIAFGEESYSGLGEKIRVNNASSKLIQAECGMGEIVLEFPNSL